jgi:hypothetical protein
MAPPNLSATDLKAPADDSPCCPCSFTVSTSSTATSTCSLVPSTLTGTAPASRDPCEGCSIETRHFTPLAEGIAAMLIAIT